MEPSGPGAALAPTDMADQEEDDSHIALSLKRMKLFDSLFKYVEVPLDESKINQSKQSIGILLKYGLILAVFAVLGFWIPWLTIRTGQPNSMENIASNQPNNFGGSDERDARQLIPDIPRTTKECPDLEGKSIPILQQ